jgi:hypothetical protein
VLHEVHSDQGDEFSIDMHLQGAARTAEGEPGYTVRQLWVQRVRVE